MWSVCQKGILDCPSKMLIGDGSSLAHHADMSSRFHISDTVLYSGNPGLRYFSILHLEMNGIWRLFSGFFFEDAGVTR